MADTAEHPILTAVKSQVQNDNLPFMMAVHAKIKPGQQEAFETAFSTCIQLTREEHGCIAYDLNRSQADPTEYINYERWASVAALAAHLAAEHTVALLNTIGPWMDGMPVVKVYAVAGE